MASKAEREVNYKVVDATLNFNTKKATCKLKIPSNDLPQYEDPLPADPTACLVVKDVEDIHCVKMMSDCVHRNILHALAVAETKEFFGVWTESFTDSVLKYLESSSLGTRFSNAIYVEPVILPTANLQTFIRQIFDGLGYLWARGKYHGNFKLENTYYNQNSCGDKVVKLTCFKLKDRDTVTQCQVEDCQDVGVALKDVSKAAAALNLKGHSFDCYVIDDLAARLQNFARTDFEFIKQEILGHPFFWGYNDFKTFFISDIPVALNNPDFRNNVEACEKLCGLPWDNNSYQGFLQLMKDYRVEKNIPEYDVYSRVNYVQFLSGLYVHEKELKMSTSVDTVVRATNPRAIMILYKLIPR